jgi:hypothetical protein
MTISNGLAMSWEEWHEHHARGARGSGADWNPCPLPWSREVVISSPLARLRQLRERLIDCDIATGYLRGRSVQRTSR